MIIIYFFAIIKQKSEKISKYKYFTHIEKNKIKYKELKN